MDLIYLPESLAFQSRSIYTYGRDEQPWININELPAKPIKEKTVCTKDEKNCSICKNRQKKGLSTYIRKARRDSEREGCITEEAEEEEELEVKEPPAKDSLPHPSPGTQNGVKAAK